MTQRAKIIVGFMANVGNVFLSNVYKRFFYFLHVFLTFFSSQRLLHLCLFERIIVQGRSDGSILVYIPPKSGKYWTPAFCYEWGRWWGADRTVRRAISSFVMKSNHRTPTVYRWRLNAGLQYYWAAHK